MNITEHQGYFQNYKVLEELTPERQAKDGIIMRVGGIFQVEDEKNKNNRIYPSTTWDSVFANKEFQERLVGRGLFGEVDHPADGGALKRTSHIVTKLERIKDPQGKKAIYGEAEILNTPDGRIVATIFKARGCVGTSSRGDGSIKRDEAQEADVVQQDYMPEGWDFVIRPSVSSATPRILSEEELKKNDNTVINALTILVKESTDTRLLLRVFNVLEGYTGEQSNGLRALIEQKLICSATDKNIATKEDVTMEIKEKDLSEVQKDVIQMARDLAEKEVTQCKATFNEATQKLNAQVVDLSTRLEHRTKEVEAAEKLIKAFQSRLQTATKSTSKATRTHYESQNASVSTNLRKTAQRLEAAKQVIKVAIKKLREAKGSKYRAEAGERLVQALLDRRDRSKVESFIDNALSGIKDDSRRQQVKSLVANAETVEQVKERLQVLEAVLQGRKNAPTREPLPGDKPLTILESDTTTSESNHTAGNATLLFIDRVREKLG